MRNIFLKLNLWAWEKKKKDLNVLILYRNSKTKMNWGQTWYSDFANGITFFFLASFLFFLQCFLDKSGTVINPPRQPDHSISYQHHRVWCAGILKRTIISTWKMLCSNQHLKSAHKHWCDINYLLFTTHYSLSGDLCCSKHWINALCTVCSYKPGQFSFRYPIGCQHFERNVTIQWWNQGS